MISNLKQPKPLVQVDENYYNKYPENFWSAASMTERTNKDRIRYFTLQIERVILFIDRI